MSVAFTAFVDGTFGVGTPILTNPAAPFLTIVMAISAILNSTTPPSEFIQWNIQVAPGTYFESPVIPGFTNLIGAGQATSIVGTVTVTGAGIVRDLLIDTFNAPGVIVNRPINIGDAAFLNVVIINSWAGVFTSIISAVNVIIGDCTFESGAIFGSFSGSAPLARLVTSTGGLALFNVDTSTSATAGIVQAEVFGFSGAKSTITSCVVGVSFVGNTEGIIFAGANINAAAIGNRITVTSNGTAHVELVNAADGAIMSLTDNFVDLSGVLPESANILAKGVHVSGSAPIVRLLGNAFTQTGIPPSVGVFGQLSFDLYNEDGTLQISGGFHAPIKNVHTLLYTVLSSDYTILASLEHAVISLASGNPGQVVNIKNTSTAKITIVGNIFDATYIEVHSGDSVTLQTDGSQWYILSDY